MHEPQRSSSHNDPRPSWLCFEGPTPPGAWPSQGRRVVLPRGIAGNRGDCEVMVDQSRAIDNRRLVRPLKPLPRSILAEVAEKLRRLGEL